jgi:hypothetical protein
VGCGCSPRWQKECGDFVAQYAQDKDIIMKKNIRFSAIVLAVISSFVFSMLSLSARATGSQAPVYTPLWMQPYTVIVYDSNLDYTIIQGGELSASDLIGREDIAMVGLTTTDPEMLAEPNTKVEYDLHGFHQNTYYLVPGTVDDYQLSPPAALSRRYDTGGIAQNTTYSYGSYLNCDTQQNQLNVLTRAITTITGSGRITYYYNVTGDHSNTFMKYDCAAKQDYCDVPTGTSVLVKNTYTSPNKSQTFYKQDCGGLPRAILDIWNHPTDSTKQPIKEITTNGTLDNVYSGAISLTVPQYWPY